MQNLRSEDLTLEEVQKLTKAQWISLAEEIDIEVKRTSRKISWLWLC